MNQNYIPNKLLKDRVNRIITSSAGVGYIENYWNSENFRDIIEVTVNISNK